MKKELFRKVIENLLQRGADYAEVFYEHKIEEGYNNIDNKRYAPSYAESEGVSIRAFVDKKVFFEATTDFSDHNLIKISENMLGEIKSNQTFDFSKIDEFGGHWFTKLDFDQAKTLIDKSVATVFGYGHKTTNASAQLSVSSSFKVIASSGKNYVEFPTHVASFNVSAMAKDGAEQQSSSSRVSKGMDWPDFLDYLKTLEIEKDILHITKVANDLLTAQTIEGGDMPVILPSGFGAVLFHEACGHPLEAAAVAKKLSTYAGKEGQQVASSLVTLVDDGTLVGERGSSKYDDEGQLQQKRVLVEKGILKNFLVDKYNGDLMGVKANGASRKESFKNIPTSRMSNTFILKGDSTVEEIIKNTKYGFYAKALGGGQVDPFSGQFNFGVTEGYLIKDGKIAYLVKPATLIGNGIEALLKVDMVADDFELASGTCGASSGMIPVTVGQPTLRVSKMTVGGK